uniref:Uncharacterized protein n=1 Tax=Rhizophora mucronata TaxID=61149 RepID=A0A2P2P2E5_RHIMU
MLQLIKLNSYEKYQRTDKKGRRKKFTLTFSSHISYIFQMFYAGPSSSTLPNPLQCNISKQLTELANKHI